jgi:hypothetical protein
MPRDEWHDAFYHVEFVSQAVYSFRIPLHYFIPMFCICFVSFQLFLFDMDIAAALSQGKFASANN